MNSLKRTAWMVVGALVLLLGLGFADPGNTRLMPSFFSKDPPPGVLPKGSAEEEEISRAIVQFNLRLSAAYLALDPASLVTYPINDDLRRNYVEEIAFLKKDGRALEMTVRDIRTEEVRRLPNQMLSVNTVESVRVRYLNAPDRTVLLAYPETIYAMNYTLEKSASGWKIASAQTLKPGKQR